MEIEEVEDDVLCSIVHYRDSEHYSAYLNVEPVILRIVKKRATKRDEIECIYSLRVADRERMPNNLRRFHKGIMVSIKIYNVTKNESESIYEEILGKFKILNKSDIYRPSYKYDYYYTNPYNLPQYPKNTRVTLMDIFFTTYEQSKIYSFPKYFETKEYVECK